MSVRNNKICNSNKCYSKRVFLMVQFSDATAILSKWTVLHPVPFHSDWLSFTEGTAHVGNLVKLSIPSVIEHTTNGCNTVHLDEFSCSITELNYSTAKYSHFKCEMS